MFARRPLAALICPPVIVPPLVMLLSACAAESAPAKVDVVTDGTLAWNDWFTPYFGPIAAHPEIEGFVYISYDWGKASYYASELAKAK